MRERELLHNSRVCVFQVVSSQFCSLIEILDDRQPGGPGDLGAGCGPDPRGWRTAVLLIEQRANDITVLATTIATPCAAEPSQLIH